ncbi:MAG: hypothetical protein ACRCZO_13435 [Cetobacterium sp.]
MNKNKITKKIFGFCIIFIIFFITQLILDVYIEKNASDLYDKHFKHSFYIIYFLIGVISISIIRKIIEFYEEEIADLNEKIKDESRLIWEKYHELQKFKTDEAINKTLEEFVTNFSEVLSVQIYQYNKFYRGKDVCFKVNHVYSYIEEASGINAIIQDYYYIKKNMYDRLIEAIDKESSPLLSKFISLNHNYLFKKDINKIDLYDCTNYNLLYFAFQKLLHLSNQNSIVSNLLPEDKEQKLKQFKRGGILRGILAKDYYYFNNIKDAKKNRIYVTKCIELHKKPHVVLFSFHNHLNIPREQIYELATKYINEISKFQN